MIKAKESAQILKARKKLLQQIADENKHVTAQALDKIRKSIHHWISRHADDRINLKSKEITLFDENRHSAKPQNRFILNLLQNLKDTSKQKSKKLTGRIVSQSNNG
jgi:hypothetical protein